MHAQQARLTARVTATNKAHAHANRLFQELTDIFRPLLGRKILKANGQLLAKYATLLPQFPCTPALHIYRHVDAYSLAWCVRTCESIPPHSCVYYTVTVYIGDLRGGTLEKLAQHLFAGRTNYTVEEILSKRAKYEAAQHAADAAREDLYPFGEHDE